MTTVTIQLENLITNFTACTIAHLFVVDDEDEHSDVRETYFRDLRGLTSSRIRDVASTIRRLFDGGFTSYLVTGIDFELLESNKQNDEEYSIVIKKNEETVCILCQNEVCW